MGWKVKQWRPEHLRAVVGEQALEAARLTREQALDAARATHEQAARHAARILAAAERDARRRRRSGRRATRAADAELARLERLGDDLLARVQDHRGKLRVADSPVPSERRREGPLETTVPRRPARLTRGRRARLRSSPLAELMRSTERQAPAGR